MIIPDDSKYVGVCENNPNRSGRVYRLTKYLIERSEEGTTVYEVNTDTSTEGAMVNIEGVKVIAEKEEVFEYNETVDLQNKSVLVELASMFCTGEVTTTIFKGIDSHLTFVKDPDLSVLHDIEVWDVVPPHPSMMMHWLTKLKDAGAFNDLFVRFLPKLVNLTSLELNDLVVPCSCSELPGPHIDRDVIPDNFNFVGCDTFVEVMEAMYPETKYKMTSFCPYAHELIDPKAPFIAKCCRKERTGPVKFNDVPGYIVHWGINQLELIKAVRSLVERLE